MKFLQLRFLPVHSGLALLILRIWLGLSMLLFHGLVKLQNFSHLSKGFDDPFHIGSQASLVLCLFSEVVCSVFLVFGLFSRLAALIGVIELGVAFWSVHHFALTGPHNGQFPLIYIAAYLTIFIAGAGKFSLDRALGAK